MRVIVTGASRGIGKQICKSLLTSGMHVYGVGRSDKDSVAELLIEFPRFSYISLDISKETAGDKIAQLCLEKFGGIDW